MSENTVFLITQKYRYITQIYDYQFLP